MPENLVRQIILAAFCEQEAILIPLVKSATIRSGKSMTLNLHEHTQPIVERDAAENIDSRGLPFPTFGCLAGYTVVF